MRQIEIIANGGFGGYRIEVDGKEFERKGIDLDAYELLKKALRANGIDVKFRNTKGEVYDA